MDFMDVYKGQQYAQVCNNKAGGGQSWKHSPNNTYAAFWSFTVSWKHKQIPWTE